ncbi:hypothetical protein DLAC_04961 [Tieghemostelium lacteum]|uniref:Uncharacterized protein n=1 Tax=Tieghemostelium lacteum TaxID=361077 RepID=A0A151ZHW4_TIELA|nr:hypothetical protein DLAC_04961 [Tieghemostelium lacteum]|eukprot:KYQ93588.1 hypothetical protein DLAC_04961 [Tieghemostelium lacteum]
MGYIVIYHYRLVKKLSFESCTFPKRDYILILENNPQLEKLGLHVKVDFHLILEQLIVHPSIKSLDLKEYDCNDMLATYEELVEYLNRNTVVRSLKSKVGPIPSQSDETKPYITNTTLKKLNIQTIEYKKTNLLLQRWNVVSSVNTLSLSSKDALLKDSIIVYHKKATQLYVSEDTQLFTDLFDNLPNIKRAEIGYLNYIPILFSVALSQNIETLSFTMLLSEPEICTLFQLEKPKLKTILFRIKDELSSETISKINDNQSITNLTITNGNRETTNHSIFSVILRNKKNLQKFEYRLSRFRLIDGIMAELTKDIIEYYRNTSFNVYIKPDSLSVVELYTKIDTYKCFIISQTQ